MEDKAIKLLAIDDNPDNLISLKALIREAFPNAIVHTALTGEKGIELAGKEEIDIILLDIVMPGMDGFEVCRRVKADEKLQEIPVIFITALKGDKESRIIALECGAEAFIAKPIDESELTAQIRAMKKIREACVHRQNEKELLTKLVDKKTSELIESEQRYRSIFECAALGICNISLEGVFLHANDSFCKTVGYTEEELKQIAPLDITHPDDKDKSEELLIRMIAGNFKSTSIEKRYIRKDGKEVSVILTMNVIKNEADQPIYTVTTIQDISDRIEAEKELIYIGYHDQLTGVYNRRYFEAELKRLDTTENLPISIVMGDLNGLKLINDSLGYGVGDQLLKKVSEIIKEQCREGDILARIGGDEFVMIFPRTDKTEASEIISLINKGGLKEKIANLDISISFGVDTKKNENQIIADILGNAENDMYKRKLYERASVKSKAIDIIKNTLFEKSNRESMHSERVSLLASSIARQMKFEKADINKITVAGLIHDIGKIGVDEKILNKPGRLDEEEWIEIRKHPETGWRILRSTEEFSEVSEYVLSHHERWDGKGYPNGLMGKEIPIEARIIAIADSYDAMTSKRSYRDEFENEVAIEELKRCAGTQFDPDIVEIFVNQVLHAV